MGGPWSTCETGRGINSIRWCPLGIRTTNGAAQLGKGHNWAIAAVAIEDRLIQTWRPIHPNKALITFRPSRQYNYSYSTWAGLMWLSNRKRKVGGYHATSMTKIKHKLVKSIKFSPLFCFLSTFIFLHTHPAWSDLPYFLLSCTPPKELRIYNFFLH